MRIELEQDECLLLVTEISNTIFRNKDMLEAYVIPTNAKNVIISNNQKLAVIQKKIENIYEKEGL